MTEQERYVNRYWGARGKAITASTQKSHDEINTALPVWDKSLFKNRLLSKLQNEHAMPGATINDFSKAQIKAAARSITSTRRFVSLEETFHRGAVDKLKETKNLWRIYKLGGSTAMNNTSFTSYGKGGKVEVIDGAIYHAYGEYNMGGVIVIFFEPTDSKEPFKVSVGGIIH